MNPIVTCLETAMEYVSAMLWGLSLPRFHKNGRISMGIGNGDSAIFTTAREHPTVTHFKTAGKPVPATPPSPRLTKFDGVGRA